MSRLELSHRYKRQEYQTGEGLFGNILGKIASAITSDVSKKLIKKTVNSVIDHGTKKAGEFIVDQVVGVTEQAKRRPGDVIREHFATVRKPPLDEEEKYLQDKIDRILIM